MFELIVRIALALVGLYLVAGLAICIPLHRNGLARIDHGTSGTSLFFRLLITPGLITLWPLLIHRWRQAQRGHLDEHTPERPGAQESLRRWHGLAISALAVLSPGLVATALVLRGPVQPLPTAPVEIPGSQDYWVQQATHYGQAFPGLPVDVTLARDVDRHEGLLLEARPDTTIPPTALYWSGTMEASGELPKTAVLLGVIWGPHTRWFPFAGPEMAEQGYWIAYSFAHHTVEAFEVPRKGEAEAP